LKNDCVHCIHSGLIFIPCQVQSRMDSLPNLSLSSIAYPSIRPPCLSHVVVQIPQNQLYCSFAEREQIADRRLSLPNASEKSFLFTRRTPDRAGPTGQTPYQILVLTESTSRVRLGVFYIVQDTYNFLSEYFSTVVLVPHVIRCRVAQAE
jgi:hypothetical protein